MIRVLRRTESEINSLLDDIVKAMEDYYDRHCVPPTVREIMGLVGIKGYGHIEGILSDLVERGRVVKVVDGARCHMPASRMPKCAASDKGRKGDDDTDDLRAR